MAWYLVKSGTDLPLPFTTEKAKHQVGL